MVVSSETWPEDSASAFAVQTCSSRKPFPTPPPFEYPILYCFAAALGDASPEASALALGAAALGAAALGAAVPAGVLQAAANTAAAARTASNLARVVPFSIMRAPPQQAAHRVVAPRDDVAPTHGGVVSTSARLHL